MLCQPTYENGVLTCTACGVDFEKVTASDLAAIGGDLSKIRRSCGVTAPAVPVTQEPASVPSAVRRAANFAKAAARHVAAGMPKCSQAQIEARLAVCRGCHLYQVDAASEGTTSGTCTHESCGCRLSRRAAFRNKLAWADQECPLGKWGKAPADAS
jgi:hypothetical protein